MRRSALLTRYCELCESRASPEVALHSLTKGGLQCIESEPLTTAPKRQRTEVESGLEQKLLAYAAVASAAGVAMLAVPQNAEAKIVYTAVNAQITFPYALDLNADGLAISTWSTGRGEHCRLMANLLP